MASEVAQEFEEMGQDFRELADLYKEAWETGILPLGLFTIALYVVTWVILFKLGLVDNSLQKAKRRGRVVTARYADSVPDDVFQGIGIEDGEIRMFNYSYTHPLTGKEMHYELDLREKNTAPPMELPLYYTPAYKFFSEKDAKANAHSPFWIVLGYVLPGVIVCMVMVATGFEM